MSHVRRRRAHHGGPHPGSFPSRRSQPARASASALILHIAQAPVPPETGREHRRHPPAESAPPPQPGQPSPAATPPRSRSRAPWHQDLQEQATIDGSSRAMQDRPASRSPGPASWAALSRSTSLRSGSIASGSRRCNSSRWAVSRCQPLGLSSAATSPAVSSLSSRGIAAASCRPGKRDRSCPARCRPAGRASASQSSGIHSGCSMT